MTSRYNDPKRLYVIHRKDTHEYLQEISTNWGYFCTTRLFNSKEMAHSTLKSNHPNLNAEVLEVEITKWQCREPLEGRP